MLLPSVETVRLTNPAADASDSFHRSNDGAGDASALLVMRIVQVPLRGGIDGLQALLSQIRTKTWLSPLTASGALVASTCTAPSPVQTIPESAPRAAPTMIDVGLTSWTVMESPPSYQRSSHTLSLSAPLFCVYERLNVSLIDAPAAGSD